MTFGAELPVAVQLGISRGFGAKPALGTLADRVFFSDNPVMDILHYLTAEGRDLLQDWLDRLRDMRARIAIQRRLDRLALGNFGDHRFCQL